jgi:Protein of unknown function (DUF3105)
VAKTTTPPPPRRVQAPKVRSGGDRGGHDNRNRLILYGLGAVGFIALIVVLGIVVLGGGGGSSSLADTLKAAGCTYKVYDIPPPNGDMHVSSLTAKPKWATNPPSGGQHYGDWAIWNFYDQPVIPVQAVHNLEHGGMLIWYGPGISEQTKKDLRAFYNESPNGLLVTPYADFGKKIALAAWTSPTGGKQYQDPAHVGQAGYYGVGHLAVCTGFDEKAFTAFRNELRAKGPERFLLSQMVAGGQ